MIELSTGFFAWLFRFILTAIDCLIFKLFFSIKEEGAKNVPEEGAYILYGNHASFLDGPAIAACLPRRPVFQLFISSSGRIFRPFEKSSILWNLVKMGRFIPFDFSTHFLEALRSCYLVLQHGKGLCFFPEGLRSSTGKIGKFKKGSVSWLRRRGQSSCLWLLKELMRLGLVRPIIPNATRSE